HGDLTARAGFARGIISLAGKRPTNPKRQRGKAPRRRFGLVFRPRPARPPLLAFRRLLSRAADLVSPQAVAYTHRCYCGTQPLSASRAPTPAGGRRTADERTPGNR